MIHTQNQEYIKIDSEKLEEKIQAINQNTKKAFLSKQQKKTVEKLEKEQLPKLQENEKHPEHFGGRNSYSKIDTDATFMRMKEDQMKNDLQCSNFDRKPNHFSFFGTSKINGLYYS